MTLRKTKTHKGPGASFGKPLKKARPTTTPQDVSREIALLAAQAGLDRKARGVEIIDVQGQVDYADYLVLMTGSSDRHVASIARAVEADLSAAQHKAVSVEGLPQAQWVLVDLVDVVVHVFHEQARAVYDLDGLWMDARRVPVPNAPPESYDAGFDHNGPRDPAVEESAGSANEPADTLGVGRFTHGR